MAGRGVERVHVSALPRLLLVGLAAASPLFSLQLFAQSAWNTGGPGTHGAHFLQEWVPAALARARRVRACARRLAQRAGPLTHGFPPCAPAAHRQWLNALNQAWCRMRTEHCVSAEDLHLSEKHFHDLKCGSLLLWNNILPRTGACTPSKRRRLSTAYPPPNFNEAGTHAATPSEAIAVTALTAAVVVAARLVACPHRQRVAVISAVSCACVAARLCSPRSRTGPRTHQHAAPASRSRPRAPAAPGPRRPSLSDPLRSVCWAHGASTSRGRPAPEREASVHRGRASWVLGAQ